MMRHKRVQVVTIIGVLFAGMLMGYFYAKTVNPSSQKPEEKERAIKYWVAPMDPNYRRSEPGKSPMGMDLVPVYEDSSKPGKENNVKISSQVEQNLGVKTQSVRRQDIYHEIDTVGYATVDENNIEHVTPYVEGWIKHLAVKSSGEQITEGQLLMTLYSPTLIQAQEEYLLALASNNVSLQEAGEQKLLTLGVSQQQINALRDTRKVMEQIKVFAPRSGILSKLNVREGMYVKPETKMMTLDDLSTIWVIAEVFERQAHLVAKGQLATATFPYWPDKEWIGQVDYVYPELDPKTHTLRARLIFPNADMTIKPNMYANIEMFTQSKKQVLTIPRESLIRTGKEDRVILALGHGDFQPQTVRVGGEFNGYYEVIDGLEEGDKVVTSGQFLIDSESSLTASFDRMSSNEQEDSSTSLKEYMAMGVIKAIDEQQRTLLLDHQAIPEINMPAMEMNVHVDKNVSLQGLSVGDAIHFIFILKNPDELWVTTIHKMPPDSSDQEGKL